MNFNIQDLSDLLSHRNNISRKEADTFVRLFFETISTFLVRDKIVKVKGLGTFKLVEVSDRESVDVNTGQRILISGHSKVSFTPDSTLRDQVNKPFIDFETVILNDDTDIEEMERIDKTPVPTPTDEDADTTVEAVMEEEGIEEIEVAAVAPLPEPEESESEEEESEDTTPETAETIEKSEIIEPSVAETPEEEEESSRDTLSKEEPVVATPHEKPVQPSAVPQPKEEEVSPVSVAASTENSSIFLSILKYTAVLLLMLVSYFAGYYRIFCPEEAQTPEATITESPIVLTHDTPAEADSVPQISEVEEAPIPTEPEHESDSLENVSLEKDVEQYPQIPGGKYKIVGTKATHVMSVGDNLYKISRNTYGSIEMVQYIVVYNQFKNPDVIPPGYRIKLPELEEVK